jgi:putative PIG3 family NAD(P)H quinone oxidoreductase
MKAVVITKPGPPEVLQVEDRPVPQPRENEVLVRIKAAGVNRPDVTQRKGFYPAPPGAPADIPGLEVSGVVEVCGVQVDRFKPGDQVCALLPGGGYAEFAVANGGHCLPLPTNFNFLQAASIPETVFTVWHNVFQLGKLKEGENFLVHGGSSGIGITAIQLAKAYGAKVFATAGSGEKCNACVSLGADHCINYNERDFESELKDEGVDVILDMVGGDYIEKNIRLLKTGGRLIFINAMKGGKGTFDAIDLMRRRLMITGSTLRNRESSFKAELASAVFRNVWPVIEQGNFNAVIHKTFKMHEAADAHRLMESSAHIGKIVLVNE